MSIITWSNEKIKKMDWLDFALVKTGCVAFGILLVIFVPELLELNIWWFVGIFVLALIRPLYRIYFK
jgi:hypothetical protein